MPKQNEVLKAIKMKAGANLFIDFGSFSLRNTGAL